MDQRYFSNWRSQCSLCCCPFIYFWPSESCKHRWDRKIQTEITIVEATDGYGNIE